MSRKLYKVSAVLLLSVAPWVNGQATSSHAAEPVVSVQQTKGSCQGVVKDSKGEPVIGASVRVKGTTLGTCTDLDGRFLISNVKPGATLEVRSFGYITRTVTFSGKELTIVLDEDPKLLEEVIVIGYGVQKKVNLSGAVASVDRKQLQARPIQNLSNGLQGLVPGLTITGTNGAPGLDNGSMQIRGIGTLNGSAPYILVDGVESGTLNAIDPSDIESISVLKDASSAAIYGSKAANGVILITTKRGRSGKAQVSYSGYVGMQSATNLIERMSSGEYAELYAMLEKEAGAKPRFSAEEIEKFKAGNDPKYPNTDWYALAFKTGVQHRHNVNISGGTDMVKYMASLGYLNQTGILPNAARQQFNGRANLDMKLSKRLLAKMSLAYIKNKYSDASSAYAGGGNDQIIRQLNIIAPWIPNRRAEGDGYGTVSDGNPIAWLDYGLKVWRDNNNFTGTAALEYDVLDELKLSANASYVNNIQHYSYFQKFIQYNPNKATDPNELRDRYYAWDRVSLDLLANYKKSFGEHNLTGLLGWHLEDFNLHNLATQRKSFPNNELTDLDAGDASTQTNGGLTRRLAMLSYFGRINYDYAGKYLLEANLRADASSRFADGHRWGYFPSFSAAWRINRELFLEDVKWLSDLKLRASWGVLGNQDALGDYYPAINTYAIDAGYPIGGSLKTGYYQGSYKLEAISWEKTTTTGFGLDFAFLKSRITGSIDIYRRKTTDMLMNVDVPREFALGAYRDNVGSVDNKGLEVSLGYRDNWGDWNFGVSANFAYNKNEITSLGGNVKYLGSGSVRNAVGQAMNTYFIYKADGFLQSDKEAADFSAKHKKAFGRDFKAGDIRYVDVDGNGTINGNDRIYAGSQIPVYTFGLNLNAGYKGIDFSMMFNGAADVYRMFSGEVYGRFDGDTGHPSTIWRDAWSRENPGGKMPRLHLTTDSPSSPDRVASTFWLQDTSYIRLKNLQLGYTLPKSVISALGLNNLRVYYSAENLFTLDRMRLNVDPEATSARLSSYPLLRTHSIGLNVSF